MNNKLIFTSISFIIIFSFFQNCSNQKGFESSSNIQGTLSTETALKIELISKPDYHSNLSDGHFVVNVKEQNSVSPIQYDVYYKINNEQNWQIVSGLDFNTSILNEGFNTIEIKIKSNQGLESEVLQYIWVVDTTPPTVQLNNPPPDILGTNNFQLMFSFSDKISEVSEVNCKVDEFEFSNCQSPFVINNLTQGQHSVSVWAKDKAGNVSISIIKNFAVNTNMPSVEIVQHPKPIENSNSAVFEFTNTGNSNDIQQFECSIDNSSFSSCTNPVQLSSLSESTHKFSVRGKLVTLGYTPTIDFSWKIDTTPPTVSIISPKAGDIVDLEQLVFSFQGNDGNGSGVQNYQCAIGPNFIFETCSSPYIIQKGKLNSGNNEFRVKAIDAALLTSQIASVNFILKDWNIPLITVNLAGGAALSGNIIPLDSSKNLLPSYSKLGMGLVGNFTITESYGAKWYSSSGLLSGLKSN